MDLEAYRKALEAQVQLQKVILEQLERQLSTLPAPTDPTSPPPPKSKPALRSL